MLVTWNNQLLTKFPPNTTPTILYLEDFSKHHQSEHTFLLTGPAFYGTGESREQLTEYALGEMRA